MNSIDTSSMTDIAAQVLETAAFACGFGCSRDELPEASDGLVARIAFSGPVCGRLLIAAPTELCRLLVANTLSLDEDEVDASAAADNLKELANIICGQWLTAEFGDQPVFRLSAPRVRTLSERAWGALAERQRVACLLVEDQAFLVDHAVRRAFA